YLLSSARCRRSQKMWSSTSARVPRQASDRRALLNIIAIHYREQLVEEVVLHGTGTVGEVMHLVQPFLVDGAREPTIPLIEDRAGDVDVALAAHAVDIGAKGLYEVHLAWVAAETLAQG